MTFSLVARCADTGQFGIAISSSSPAVAARCVHLRAGVGGVASQNVTDPSLGGLILDELEAGSDAARALANVTSGRQHIEYRQLLVVDRTGGVSLHSGRQVLGVWGEARGMGCAAGGNLLTTRTVPQAMVDAFTRAKGHLAERLMVSLLAGRDAGGEAGPVHSAGLQVVDQLNWPLVDLRVDWQEDGCPIEALGRIWALYRPQMHAYVQRALDPTLAPSYGVPGDE